MSDPSRPVSGFVPLGDMAAAVDLPGGRGLSPATPQARHHVTTLQQVNQLVEASEAEPDLGFMARLLALCSLPRSNPGSQIRYIRHNGPYTLAMTAGVNTRLPYGTLAASAPGVGVHRSGTDAIARAGPRPVVVRVHAKARHGGSQRRRTRRADAAP